MDLRTDREQWRSSIRNRRRQMAGVRNCWRWWLCTQSLSSPMF